MLCQLGSHPRHTKVSPHAARSRAAWRQNTSRPTSRELPRRCSWNPRPGLRSRYTPGGPVVPVEPLTAISSADAAGRPGRSARCVRSSSLHRRRMLLFSSRRAILGRRSPMPPTYRHHGDPRIRSSKISGIGRSGTGTTSRHAALGIPGVRSIHCPKLDRRHELVDERDAASDTPAACSCRELDARDPGSRRAVKAAADDAVLVPHPGGREQRDHRRRHKARLR